MKKALIATTLVIISLLFVLSDALQLWREKEEAKNQEKSKPASLEHLYSHDLSNLDHFDDFYDPFTFHLSHFHNNPFFHRRHHHMFSEPWNEQLWKTPSQDLLKGYSALFNSDMIERDNDFHIQIDLPGIDLKDLNIAVEDNGPYHKYLSIKAERKREIKEEKPLLANENKRRISSNATSAEEQHRTTCDSKEYKEGAVCPSEEQEHEPKYIRQERIFGKIERNFHLPESADVSNAKSRYNNGVLTITIPKLASTPVTKKHLNIETH